LGAILSGYRGLTAILFSRLFCSRITAMMSETFLVPENVTFEQAIALTQTLTTQIKQGQLISLDLEEAIAALVQTQNGARGFFVTYLTDPDPGLDQPDPGVISALQTAPEIVAELLVKNLAMSSVMAVVHRQQQNGALAQGSERVRSRTTDLIRLLQSDLIAERARQLYQSAVTGEGEYTSFLKKWGYDAEQKQVIQQAIAQTFPTLATE
jgi:cell division protein FtsB